MGCRSPAVGTGVGFNRYDADFGGADDTTLTEWSPFLRYFLSRKTMTRRRCRLWRTRRCFWTITGARTRKGTRLPWSAFKKLRMSDGFSSVPVRRVFTGGRVFSFGGGDAERALYLYTSTAGAWLNCLRQQRVGCATAEEYSFRRETFRAHVSPMSAVRSDASSLKRSKVPKSLYFDLAGHTA